MSRTPSFFHGLRHIRWVAFFLAASWVGSLAAETLTITDQKGRTLSVEVLSIDGDVVKIRRDDGQVFSLSLATLIETDQKKLKDWEASEAAKPKVFPADAIEVTLSRAKFGSSKTETAEPYTLTYTDGTVRTITRTRVNTNEQWGYSVTLKNRLLQTVTGLEAEYILYTGAATSPVRGQKVVLPVGSVPNRNSIILKTGTITLVKISYKGEGLKPFGDTLYGVWLRLYKDGVLIREISSPEAIAQNGSW